MTEIAARPFTAASFNQFLREKKLMASRCTECRALYLPPRAICPACHGDRLEWEEMIGKGRLAAFTGVHITPTFMAQQGYGRGAPYIAGIVELEEGVKISARIVGLDASKPETLTVGTPLAVDYLENGDTVYLAFKPE